MKVVSIIIFIGLTLGCGGLNTENQTGNSRQGSKAGANDIEDRLDLSTEMIIDVFLWQLQEFAPRFDVEPRLNDYFYSARCKPLSEFEKGLKLTKTQLAPSEYTVEGDSIKEPIITSEDFMSELSGVSLPEFAKDRVKKKINRLFQRFKSNSTPSGIEINDKLHELNRRWKDLISTVETTKNSTRVYNKLREHLRRYLREVAVIKDFQGSNSMNKVIKSNTPTQQQIPIKDHLEEAVVAEPARNTISYPVIFMLSQLNNNNSLTLTDGKESSTAYDSNRKSNNNINTTNTVTEENAPVILNNSKISSSLTNPNLPRKTISFTPYKRFAPIKIKNSETLQRVKPILSYPFQTTFESDGMRKLQNSLSLIDHGYRLLQNQQAKELNTSQEKGNSSKHTRVFLSKESSSTHLNNDQKSEINLSTTSKVSRKKRSKNNVKNVRKMETTATIIRTQRSEDKDENSSKITNLPSSFAEQNKLTDRRNFENYFRDEIFKDGQLADDPREPKMKKGNFAVTGFNNYKISEMRVHKKTTRRYEITCRADIGPLMIVPSDSINISSREESPMAQFMMPITVTLQADLTTKGNPRRVQLKRVEVKPLRSKSIEMIPKCFENSGSLRSLKYTDHVKNSLNSMNFRGFFTKIIRRILRKDEMKEFVKLKL